MTYSARSARKGGLSMSLNPKDHLPAYVRDDRNDEEIERLKGLYRQAKAVSKGLQTVLQRQRKGDLTRAEGEILSAMILQNLRACVRKELFYRPTRARLARDTGYSVRTVSKALTHFKELGLITVARYAKGGRLGDKGTGLATEFRSGRLKGFCEAMASLGYRLGKSLLAELRDLALWAEAQIEPTGKKVPGTLVLNTKRALKSTKVALSEMAQRLRKGEAWVPERPSPPNSDFLSTVGTPNAANYRSVTLNGRRDGVLGP